MRFRGVQGTVVCGIFGLTVAMTGASEKNLQRMGRQDYNKIYLHPGSHVGYHPGAKPIHMKMIFSTDDGRIIGAQAVGEADVARLFHWTNGAAVWVNSQGSEKSGSYVGSANGRIMPRAFCSKTAFT
jgi:NADPH-dependent 2,4-dienoyl-CoA reductase/sulfur reductase-like enzyme